MPIYLFRSDDGTEREEFFPVDKRPHLGARVMLDDGVEYERVIEAPQLANSKGTPNFRLHSEALPSLPMVRNWEREARKYGLPMPEKAKRYDSLGRPVFRSQHELHEYCKRDGRYAVGNPKEVRQQATTVVHEKIKERAATVAAREREIKSPVVR